MHVKSQIKLNLVISIQCFSFCQSRWIESDVGVTHGWIQSSQGHLLRVIGHSGGKCVPPVVYCSEREVWKPNSFGRKYGYTSLHLRKSEFQGWMWSLGKRKNAPLWECAILSTLPDDVTQLSITGATDCHQVTLAQSTHL